MLPFVHPAQGVERAGPQPGHLADLQEQAFRAVQQPGPQVILRERQQGLLAVLARQGVAGQ